MNAEELQVVAGAVTAYRLFDVAYAIDLHAAERLWAARTRATSTRGRLTSTPPEAVAFGVPPVEVALEPLSLQLDGAAVTAGVSVRLYDFGVATLALRVPGERLPWSQFVRLMNAMHAATGTSAGENIWAGIVAQVRTIFAGALTRPGAAAVEEDYLIGSVRAFDQALTAEALQQRVDLVPLLSGEQRPLSEAARQDLLRQRFSYYADDLVALTWDRAFIYEPRGDSDVADVLEVANAQLLEMRYYDSLLDTELPRMYGLMERAQRAGPLLASRRYANLARRLSGLVAEVTELTEKVDNALKVTEDVYLARVYAAALELFRVRGFGAAVERKLAIIRGTYMGLYQEATAGRTELIEAIIVILIAIEIVLALAGR